ncbi:hypothetical protein L9F63_023498 [Diploptera punctata]|uniref:Cytochrome P450 n=1 Tax=Diploptera punctata TaxID=6984 RepID=A0AAD7ZJ62_DIPPU|nr:hypothetical protein L9F63_023498 [Diploptera punctata]
MEIPLWVLVLIILITVIYIYIKHCYNHWKRKDIKYVEPHFLTGNCKGILLTSETMGDVYEHCYKQLNGEKYGGIYLMLKPQLLLRDPEIIKSFLLKDFEYFHDHAMLSDEKIDPLSGNLFMLTGHKWKNMRVLLSPTFTSGKMKLMFETFEECAVELRDYLKESAEIEDILEIQDVMARYTTNIIASCAFGIQCDCFKNPEAKFRKWGTKFLEQIWK